MPLWRNVVGGRENPLPLFRHIFQSSRGSVVVKDFLHEVLPPEAFAPRDLLEAVEQARELLAVHDTLVPNQTELGLASSGRLPNQRNRACPCDCGDIGVATLEPLVPLTAPLPS